MRFQVGQPHHIRLIGDNRTDADAIKAGAATNVVAGKAVTVAGYLGSSTYTTKTGDNAKAIAAGVNELTAKTGDRLQRTSTWRENLEGGLDYLKQVVVHDKLGIGADLEADMQHVVSTYACEWKEAVDNPETRKRFRHFVNSDKGDENVLFMEERGQIRPATFEERKRVIPIAVAAV